VSPPCSGFVLSFSLLPHGGTCLRSLSISDQYHGEALERGKTSISCRPACTASVLPAESLPKCLPDQRLSKNLPLRLRLSFLWSEFASLQLYGRAAARVRGILSCRGPDFIKILQISRGSRTSPMVFLTAFLILLCVPLVPPMFASSNRAFPPRRDLVFFLFSSFSWQDHLKEFDPPVSPPIPTAHWHAKIS